MNKQIITFDANEQSLIKTGGVDKYSSNKVSYIEAHFNLGENWGGYDSVRAVWFTWYECISTVLDPDGVCVVPYEVLKRTEKVMVNLVGSISEDDVLTDRITTYPIKALEVDADAKVCGSNTQPITPSEYEQFVEAVKADADRAEEAKDEARIYAGNALSSAQSAFNSETNASASEDNAKASELNAETYKNQAQTYAQNANNSAISAENAKDEAEDARDTILGMRAEATTLPEGSSATASYSDGVMSFGIPKGDTGATGATGETGATPQLSIGTVETTTEPIVTITGTAENPVLNFGLVKGDKGDTGEVSLADLSTLLPTDTASGSIASFPDGQSVIPALSVVADIEPIQSGSGTPSPDNIRPISGHDEVNVYVSPTTSEIDAEVYNVSFGTAGTVYGGTVDVVSGVLTVEWIANTRKLSTFSNAGEGTDCVHWRYFGNFFGTDAGLVQNGASVTKCNIAPYGYNTTDEPHYYVNNTNNRIELWLPYGISSDTDIQVCAVLQTPTTYQLTPTEVQTLLGQNNIWNDCGDTEVTYKADVTKWLEKQLS